MAPKTWSDDRIGGISDFRLGFKELHDAFRRYSNPGCLGDERRNTADRLEQGP